MVSSEPETRPRNPHAHLIRAEGESFLFLPDGSRFFRVPEDTATEFDLALAEQDPKSLQGLLDRHGLIQETPRVDDTPVQDPPVRAISLAVAQKCNLGCTYCYAQEGDFGSRPSNMPDETAMRSIDLLFEDAGSGDTVNVAFMGGEPLFNRKVIQEATLRALKRADETQAQVNFSITTNGTLVRESDADFFEEHGFAVTVSLDGVGEQNDRQRPTKGGKGTFETVLEKITPLLAKQRKMQVSARMTVTPGNADIYEAVNHFIELGFHSVGISPMLSSPTGKGEMSESSLQILLDQMKQCGDQFIEAVEQGRRYPFSNMVNAMKEIHKGTHRPYPCGAGAGYLGVSAEGGLYACHRFVNDEAGEMGHLFKDGLNRGLQNDWLKKRHVHFQEPCSGCWARYLCGGGCHHEVIHRGRDSCDYIRGWLHYCLISYGRLLSSRPDYFA